MIELYEPLTSREQEVYELAVTTPDSSIKIANKLKIGTTTVRTHLLNICLKFCVSSRTELIIKHYQNLIRNQLEENNCSESYITALEEE